MANKTKNELLKDIEELHKVICEKEQDLIKYEQIAACANMGEEYKLIYDNYINAGFTEEQAFSLLKTTVEFTIRDFMTDIRRSRSSNYSYRYNRY